MVASPRPYPVMSVTSCNVVLRGCTIVQVSDAALGRCEGHRGSHHQEQCSERAVHPHLLLGAFIWSTMNVMSMWLALIASRNAGGHAARQQGPEGISRACVRRPGAEVPGELSVLVSLPMSAFPELASTTPQDRNSGWFITVVCSQAREVRCAAFATTAALVVATQGADKLQFYKKPFELAGGLCKAAAMPALLQQHGLGNACTSL